MAFVTIANTCAAELRFLLNGQRAALSLAFRKSGLTATDVQTVAEACDTWWYTYARSKQGSVVQYREVYVRSLASEDGPTYTCSTHTGVTGTMTVGDQYPNNVAKCVSFRTALRGRSNRGRNYFFGFGPNQLASNRQSISTTYAAALIELYERWLPGGSSIPAGFEWVVASRQLNGVAVGRAVPIISVVLTNLNLDSMRTRLVGRGL